MIQQLDQKTRMDNSPSASSGSSNGSPSFPAYIRLSSEVTEKPVCHEDNQMVPESEVMPMADPRPANALLPGSPASSSNKSDNEGKCLISTV